MAGGTHWHCVHSQDQGQPQEPRLRRVPGLHLRAGVRRVRQGKDAGQAPELHIPVSSGYQEADEEIRTPGPSVCIHLTKPVPEVFIAVSRQRGFRLTSQPL